MAEGDGRQEDGQQEQQRELPVVLVSRPAAWGLASGCPECLEALLHLKLGDVAFAVRYTAVQPDAEEVPYVEYKDDVGFANETGGVEEFLRATDLCDLDSGLADAERSDLLAFKEMVHSSLADAAAYELWLKENERAAGEVYFAALPWPVNKALYWKQQRAVLGRLGCKSGEASSEAVGDLYRKAGAAYESLAVRLRSQRFFFNDRPTSLDAALLAHLLFVLKAPFESSRLKEEIQKHSNLVQYAENLEQYGVADSVTAAAPSFFFKTASRPSDSQGKRAKRSSASPSTSSAAQDQVPKKRNEKDKVFRKRAKYFIVAQFLSVAFYVALVGIDFGEGMDDVSGDED